MITRRDVLITLLAAPAIVQARNLMPLRVVSPRNVTTEFWPASHNFTAELWFNLDDHTLSAFNGHRWVIIKPRVDSVLTEVIGART